MKQSENYRFALPTAEDDTLADIGVISENFKTVDRVMKKNENLGVELNKFEAETLDAVVRLDAKDTDLQSQINMLSGVDMSEFQSQLDNKSDATNLVNGSAEGSLRMVDAKAEDSEYTIGTYAVATGDATKASGLASHAEGQHTTANGKGSHAEGRNTTANGEGSHAEGYITTADGEGSHAEGYGTTASKNCSHAEGYLTKASGKNSHAEGDRAESSGECSHAEGYLTKASKNCSHAEGFETTASEYGAHAEGYLTKASGKYSHAEGFETTVSGNFSHAEGYETIAGSHRQHVQGQYNIADNDNKYSHIVGNGSSDEDRSNAHTLDWDGNAWFAGDVYVGGTSQDDENAIKLTDISNTTADLQSQITAEIANRQSADTNLQSQINAKATREVAIVGSDNENSAGWYKVADGTMPALNDVSMLFAVHSTVTNKQYAGILQLNLRSATSNITCPQLGWLVRNGFEDGQVIVTTDGLNWAMYFKVTTPRYYRTFFEVLQKSDRINSALKNYNLYTNSTVETTAPTATFASTDLGSVHQTIADLTARIEALEENSSGGVSQAVLIDWDVNTNGATQGTVTKDANGLHASGNASLRIANYWNCDVSAYDGITFTAYGSGKLRVEVGGVEGEYKVLGATPTTYTIAFADIGLTELSSIEINLQTNGAYDLTVSDIFGYTNI